MPENGQLKADDGSLGDLHKIHRTYRVGTWAALSVVVIGGVLLALGPTIYRHLRHQRALRFVHAARTDIASGRWDPARANARAALASDPKEVSVLRLVADLAEHDGYAEALNYRNMAANMPGATHEDGLLLARTALTFQAFDIANQQLDRLLAQDPRDAEAWKTRSAAAFLQGDEAGAIQAAERADELNPGDRMAEYTLGTLLFESSDAARQSRGKAILWGLALSPNIQQRSALRRLALSQGLTLEENQLLLRQSERLEKPDLQDNLAALSFRAASGTQGRQDALAQAIRLGQQSSLAGRAQVAEWLHDHGAFEEMLTVLPLEVVAKNLDCVSWRLTALNDLHRWSELAKVFENTEVEMTDFFRHAGRAQVAYGTGNLDLAATEVTLAANSAPDSIPAGLFLADFAEQRGLIRSTLKLWEGLMLQPTLTRRGWREILRLARLTDSPEPIASAGSRMFRQNPNDTEILADFAYAMLLTGRQDSTVLERLSQASQAENAPRELLAVQALAFLKTGSTDEALRLFEDRIRPTVDDSPRLRLVYAATLTAGRQNKAAQEMVRTLDQKGMWPAERALLGRWAN